MVRPRYIARYKDRQGNLHWEEHATTSLGWVLLHYHLSAIPLLRWKSATLIQPGHWEWQWPLPEKQLIYLFKIDYRDGT